MKVAITVVFAGVVLVAAAQKLTQEQRQIIDDNYTFGIAKMEGEISAWKPTAEDRATPEPTVWIKKFDPTGNWATPGGMAVDHLQIRKRKEGEYSIEIQCYPCLGSYSLSRHATFREGMILFDRPVRTGNQRIFDRLYGVKRAGRLFLVTPLDVPDLSRPLKDMSWMQFLERSRKSPGSEATLDALAHNVCSRVTIKELI